MRSASRSLTKLPVSSYMVAPSRTTAAGSECAMYLAGNKIRRSKVRNKSARYRAKYRKRNQKRIARMLKG